ncbi:MAG: hypothetical protein OEW12_03220 [Deltaproteobacteria bacterium]|nr:hypothetical protein [Deltaproteobacteria bacterium]
MGLKSFFRPAPETQPETDINQVLTRLANNRTAIQVEFEEKKLHFHSVLSVKNGVIMMAKPEGLGENLTRECHVRLTVPGTHQEIRLVVSSPHVNLKSGGGAFVCSLPTQFESSHRDAVRVDTSRFSNIHLHVVNLNDKFPVIDLSDNGLKFRVLFQAGLSMFPIGISVAPAKLVASKFRLDLDELIPRVHKGLAVGCEIRFDKTKENKRFLTNLVDYLERKEERKVMVG